MSMPLLTHSGQQVNLALPQPGMIRLADIALALSRIPRFGGHTLRPWSVADHSLLVCDLMGAPAPDLALAALLHDAHEAYLGDLVLPVQIALRGIGHQANDAWRLLSADLDKAIARAVALDPEMFDHPAIQQADALALAIEARRLMPPMPDKFWPAADLPDPLPDLPARDAMGAQNAVLLRAFRLLGDRHGTRLDIAVAPAADGGGSDAVG